MVIYTVIFSRFVQLPSRGVPYTVFAFSALLPWTFFSTGLSTATMGLVSHSNLLLKVYFPREIIPLSYVFAAFADFLLASLVLSILMLYYRVPITPRILWTIPAIATMTVFLTGLALLVSAFQVRFRDVGLAMPLVLQIWMLASPVVYSLASVPVKLRGWYDVNPMVGIVETFRRALLQGASPDSGLLGWSFAVSLATAFGAYVWFKHVEKTFADII
jgi:lipopolysaccharide transport system permease protein